MKIRQDKPVRKLGRTPEHLLPATRYTCQRCGIEKCFGRSKAVAA